MAGAIGASYGISGLGGIGEYLGQGAGLGGGTTGGGYGGGENFSGAYSTVPIGPIQPVTFQTAVLPAVHAGLPSITASLTQAQIGRAANAGLIYVQTPRGYVLSKQAPAAPAAAAPPPSRPPATPAGLLGTPGHPSAPFTGPTIGVVALPGGGFAKVNPATGCPPGYHKDASGNCVLTQLLPSLPQATAVTGGVVGGIVGGLFGQPVAGAQAGAKLGEVAELARQEAAKYLPKPPRPLPAMIPASQFGRPQPVQPQPQPVQPQPQPVQPQPQFVQPQPQPVQPQPQFVQPQPQPVQPQPQFVQPQPQPVQPHPQPTEQPCLECGQPPAVLENCPPEARAAYQTLVDCGAVQLLTQEIMKKIRVVQRPGHPPVLVQAEPVCLCCDSETDMQLYQETNGTQGKCVLVRSPDAEDFRLK
jgi:hypothetical protein